VSIPLKANSKNISHFAVTHGVVGG
jgi:hypothetical protein